MRVVYFSNRIYKLKYRLNIYYIIMVGGLRLKIMDRIKLRYGIVILGV